MAERSGFTVVLRGYDRAGVEEIVAVVDAAVASGDPAAAAGALDRLDRYRPVVRLRGYDRVAVDTHLAEARSRLEALRNAGGQPPSRDVPRPPEP